MLFHALWSATRGDALDAHVQIIEALIAAGAKVPEKHPPVNATIDAFTGGCFSGTYAPAEIGRAHV